MTCPTCLELLERRPHIHEEERGYQCPDCGGSGRAEDCISLDPELNPHLATE